MLDSFHSHFRSQIHSFSIVFFLFARPAEWSLFIIQNLTLNYLLMKDILHAKLLNVYIGIGL